MEFALLYNINEASAKKGIVMAKPIEPTPVLKGKYAKDLKRSLEADQFDPAKAKFIKKARNTYRSFIRESKNNRQP